MNRRGFISLLGGAAGAALVPWRMNIEPRIFLPKLPTGWCTVNLSDAGKTLVIDSDVIAGLTLPEKFPIGTFITIVNTGHRNLLVNNNQIVAGTQIRQMHIDKKTVNTMVKYERVDHSWLLSGSNFS